MKIKEFTKQVRDWAVEKYKAGLVYKKISQVLNISHNTMKSISWKWEEYDIAANLPKQGHPSKMTGQARQTLIRKATKMPIVTLEELQKFTDRVRDCPLVMPTPNPAFMEELQEENHHWKKAISSICTLPPSMWGRQQMWKKVLYPDETKIELFSLMQNIRCEKPFTLHIILSTPFPLQNMVVTEFILFHAFL